MNGRYILIDREPIECEDLISWAEWIEVPGNRRVRLTRIGPVEVSTVFLGLDHAFGGGAPMLFETMVQWGYGQTSRQLLRESASHGFLDIQRRCSTWTEAVAQHESVCAQVREPGDDMVELWDEKERKYVEKA